MLSSGKSLYLKVVMVFLVMLSLFGSGLYFFEQGQVYRRQQAALEVATIHGHLLQEQMARSLSATYALAAIIRQGDGKIDRFEAVAGEMLSLYGGISSLQLAPGGIIRRIQPLSGNMAALGHDLLADPARNKEAFAAVESRKLTLAGPFNLLQGGVAVVGRLPVFVDAPGRGEYFWGFTTALIRIPDLLAASKLGEGDVHDYVFALSRIHPDTGQREVFWTSSGASLGAPLGYALNVPNGSWLLEVEPVQGWYSSPHWLILAVVCGVLLSFFCALLAYRLLREPRRLAEEVELQTQALKAANATLEQEIIEHWRAELALRESERRWDRVQHIKLPRAADADSVSSERTMQLDALLATQAGMQQSDMAALLIPILVGVANEIQVSLQAAGNSLEHQLTEVGEQLPIASETAQSGLSHAKEMALALRTFAQTEEAGGSVFDLNQSLAAVLSVSGWLRGEEVTVQSEFGVLPVIEGNAFLIRLMLLNVLLHVAHDLVVRGNVRIRTWVMQPSVVVEISASQVVDETAEVAAPCHGPGLSLAHSIVQQHGGRIESARHAGREAIFRIWLPIRAGAAQPVVV